MIDVTITNNTFFYIYPNEDLILNLQRNLILLNKKEKKINFILKNAFYDEFYHKGLYISFYKKKDKKESLSMLDLKYFDLPLNILHRSINEENLRKYKNYLLKKYTEGEGEGEGEGKKIENLYYLNPIAHFNIYYCKLLRKKVEEIKKKENIKIEVYFSF